MRSPEQLPELLNNHGNVSVIRANVLDLSDAEMAQRAQVTDSTQYSSSLTTFGPGILNSTRCKAINASELNVRAAA